MNFRVGFFLFCLLAQSGVPSANAGFCDDLVRRTGNYLRMKFGVLPSEIKVWARSGDQIDRDLWQYSRSHGGGEAAMTQILDAHGQVLSTSEMRTSGNYASVEVEDMNQTFISALERAYEKCDTLKGCTVRFVHTHPRFPRFSGADIKVSYNFKALLEGMGYDSMAFQMDIVNDDYAGGVRVTTYTLPAAFSMKNGSYMPFRQTERVIRKKPEIFVAMADEIRRRGQAEGVALETFFGAQNATEVLNPELLELRSLIEKKGVSFVAIASGADSTLNSAKFMTMDGKLAPVAELAMAFMDPDQFGHSLNEMVKDGSPLKVLLDGRAFQQTKETLETIADLRAVLDRLEVKSNLEVLYYVRGKLKKISLPYDWKTQDGSRIVSERGRAVLKQMDRYFSKE